MKKLIALLLLISVLIISSSAFPVDINRWRPYPVDSFCVLYLPFYKYGSEQTKIIDISGKNNHGTISGALPSQIPKSSGIELITNGGMEIGNPPTGWEVHGSTITFERSSVEKHSGSYSLHFATSAVNGNVGQVYTVHANKTYKLSFWYKIVTGSFLAFFANNDPGVNLTNTGFWAYGEEVYTTNFGDEGASGPAFLSNESSGEIYLDDVSFQEILVWTSMGWEFNKILTTDHIVTPLFNPFGNSNKEVTVIFWLSGVPSSGLLGMNGDGTTGFNIFDRGDSTLAVQINDSTSTLFKFYVTSKLAFFSSFFKCFAFSFNSGVLKLYIDGIEDTTPDKLADDSFTIASPGSNPLIIGSGWSPFPVVGGGVHCIIPEFLVFNRALSPQEIRNYYELTRSRYQ